MGLAAASLSAGAACSRPSGGGAPPPASAPPAPNPSSVAAAPSRDSAGSSQAAAARAQIQSWSRALDSHDVAALGAFYAPQVCLYGSVLARGAVVDAKRSALGGQATFHQDIIGDIDVRSRADGAVVAFFMKRSGEGEHVRTLPAKLVLRSRDDAGSLEIVEEADVARDAGSEKQDACEVDAWKRSALVAPAATDRCEETAAKVVHELPSVKAFLADARSAVEAGAVLGGAGPEDDGTGLLTFGIGFHTRDRFDARVVYTVDRKTGIMTVTVDGTDEVVPPGGLKVVANACKR
jgi:ketosteroid isomerase-like protein